MIFSWNQCWRITASSVHNVIFCTTQAHNAQSEQFGMEQKVDLKYFQLSCGSRRHLVDWKHEYRRLLLPSSVTPSVVTPLVYSRSQGLPGRRCLHLERFAGGCDFRSITAGVQTTPEDSSVRPQLSEHMCYLNFVFLLWQWSEQYFSYLGHFKKFYDDDDDDA